MLRSGGCINAAAGDVDRGGRASGVMARCHRGSVITCEGGRLCACDVGWGGSCDMGADIVVLIVLVGRLLGVGLLRLWRKRRFASALAIGSSSFVSTGGGAAA